MFKFYSIGAFNVAKTNGRCVATSELENGMAVKLDNESGEAVAGADANAIVFNVVDKPELDFSTDFVISAGEYVRGFFIDNMNGLLVEMDSTIIATAYATVAEGDIINPDADGKWAVGAFDADVLNLKVIKKTSAGNGEGILAEIIA
jgi:hypothetical protein